MDELSPEDRQTVERAQKIVKFFTQPFFTSQDYSGVKGVFVKREETINGVRKIISGECDKIPEDLFYMAGTIEEVEARWQAKKSSS